MLICLNNCSLPGPLCHQRATAGIGNNKALWTAAVSTPGWLAVLGAAALIGLWMVDQSRTVAWAHTHRDHTGRSCWLHGTMDGRTPLSARPCSSAFRPFSIKTCFASSFFCCEPTFSLFYFFPPTPTSVACNKHLIWKAKVIAQIWHVNTAWKGKAWVFSLGEHRLQKSQHGTKREAAALKLNNKTRV